MPVLYSETQVFRQWWLWALVLLPLTIVLGVIIGQIGETPISLVVIFFTIGIGFPLFIYKLQLKTQVTEKGIYIIPDTIINTY